MKSEDENSSKMRDHESKNEGGREFGHVHEPSQTQQASRKQGLADDSTRERSRQHGQHAPGHEQSGSGTRQGSSTQQGKPPGSSSGSTQDRNKDRHDQKRSD